MTAATQTALTTHVVRFLTALVLSVVTLIALIVSMRTWSALQSYTLWVLPLSIAVGFAPIIRWYRRDAYPIGLAYCPAMFFFLRYLAQLVVKTF